MDNDLLFTPIKQKEVTTEFSEEIWLRARRHGWNTPDRQLPEVPPLTEGISIKDNPRFRRAIEFILYCVGVAILYIIWSRFSYQITERSDTRADELAELNKRYRKRLADPSLTVEERNLIMFDKNTNVMIIYDESGHRRIVLQIIAIGLPTAGLAFLYLRYKYR